VQPDNQATSQPTLWLALFLAALAALMGAWVTARVFERIPHIEDEVAFVWQARTLAHGDLTIPSPPHPKSFMVPFVVDYQGQRFGKYPLGWPALLSLGVRLGWRWLVNPLLGGLAVWLIFRLGEKLFGETVGLLAALVTLTSPFFLMNSGSLLSHPWGLALTLIFVIGWLDASDGQRCGVHAWLPAVVSGMALGLLALTRPLTAVGVALPFALHGLWLLLRRPAVRGRVALVGALALMLAFFHLVWQGALTGDPFRNPYTLWWPYDTVGFGPGVGVRPEGHTLHQAWVNTRFSLQVGLWDVLGWGPLTLIPLAAGLLDHRRWRRVLLAASVPLSLVVVYLAYWVGAWLFGPRYYYEGLFGVSLLTALGFVRLAGWPLRLTDVPAPRRGWRKVRPLATFAFLALLFAVNLVGYLPARLESMAGLYGISAERLMPFRTAEARALTPALVIVHANHWTKYGALLDLEDPYLTTPFIFAVSRGSSADAALADAFPDRRIIHYDPDVPWTFKLETK